MSEYANEKLLALDQLKAAVREYDNHTPLKFIGGQDVPANPVEVNSTWDDDRDAFVDFLCSIIETSGWSSDQFRVDLEEAVSSGAFIKFTDYIASELISFKTNGEDGIYIEGQDINSLSFGGVTSPGWYEGYIYVRYSVNGTPEQTHGTYIYNDFEAALSGVATVVKPGTHTEPYWQSRDGEDLKIWNDIIDKPAFDTYLKRVDLTQEEYDALPEKDPYVVYVVSDSPAPPVQEHIKVQFIWPDNTPIEGLIFELYDHEGGMLENFETALDTFEYICFTIKDPDESYTLTYIGSPEYTTTIYPTADGFGVEVSQVQPQPQPTDGEAYFVIVNQQNGYFFRSNETYENLQDGTFEDIYGSKYEGIVFTGVETEDQWRVPDPDGELNSIWSDSSMIISPKSCSSMFKDRNKVTTVNISGFDTSSVIDMSYMFNGCSSLTNLDLSNLDTSNVINMDSMFKQCRSLTSLDLSNFNTSNVFTMGSMFQDCSSLTSLDLSSFNTSFVTTMVGMFNGCSSLTNLDLSSFDTSNATQINSMFYNCSSLTTIYANNWYDRTRTVASEYMFYNCLLLPGFDASQLTWEKALIQPDGYFTLKEANNG